MRCAWWLKNRYTQFTFHVHISYLSPPLPDSQSMNSSIHQFIKSLLHTSIYP
jgi:hypothetical protein